MWQNAAEAQALWRKHPGLELELSVEKFSSKSINRLAYGRYVASKWAQFWNDLIRSWREIAKIAINSHMAKSPMLPNGKILTRSSNRSCIASNSGWKSGIISLIWLNQSKRGLFFQRWDRDFESVLFWTGWAKLSLQYHFSTQTLMLYNFCLMVLSKFHHLATLAISTYGYLWRFWRFLARI